MDLAFLSQVDEVTLQLELARAAFEGAKAQFETARATQEEVLSQAESHGFPRTKVKKLAEERVQSLLESGLVERGGEPTPKKERAPRKAKVSETDFSVEHLNTTQGAEMATH